METKVSKNDVMSTVAAGGSAAGVYYGAKKALSVPMKKYKDNFIFSATSTNEIFREPAMKALATEKIKFKHVENTFDLILDNDFWKISAKLRNSFTGKISSGIKKVSNKILPKYFTDRKFTKMCTKMNDYANGTNACTLGDKVYVNFNKMSASSFHEMGHAKNYKDFGCGKILQNMRNPLIAKGLIGLSLASAIFLSDKNKDERVEIEKNGNFIDKGKMFLKDNCVTLAALSQVPMLAEEGLASIKGASIGKKYLSPQNMTKFNCLNLKAWSSYLIGAAFIVGTVFAADKTKNALT